MVFFGKGDRLLFFGKGMDICCLRLRIFLSSINASSTSFEHENFRHILLLHIICGGCRTRFEAMHRAASGDLGDCP